MIDLDFEGDYSGADRQMIVELTLLMHSLGVGVTYCPYTAEDFWLGCLTDVYAQLGSQPVLDYNLQCYDGGDGNDPLEWAQNAAESAPPTGIADPQAFVQPGYWVTNRGPKSYYGKCPSAIEAHLRDARPPRHPRGLAVEHRRRVRQRAGRALPRPGRDPGRLPPGAGQGLGGVPRHRL